jgi:FkbM family methyltransferase
MGYLKEFVGECFVVARLSPPRQAAKWFVGVAVRLPSILRTKSLGPADDFVGSRILIRGRGQRLCFEESGLGVAREIFGHKCYGDMRGLIPCRHILDLGANTGLFAHYALRENPDAFVTLVDIQPQLCAGASSNLAHNGFAQRAVVVNAIVGGIATDWARQYVRLHPDIPSFDIGRYVESVGGCDFLKCDIEGAEFPLFETRAPWLKRVRRMAIEYHWDHSAGERLKSCLEGAGFHVVRRPRRSLGYLLCDRVD